MPVLMESVIEQICAGDIYNMSRQVTQVVPMGDYSLAEVSCWRSG